MKTKARRFEVWTEDSIPGTPGDDTLVGTRGDDSIDGGTGADLMRGRAGDDTYLVDNAGDTVVERAGKGIDTVIASVSYKLTDHVEHLTLAAAAGAAKATGNDLDNRIVGNDSNNVLSGGLGDDTLLAGNGEDKLIGGAGNDLLTGGYDRATLEGGAGDDILQGVGDGVTFLDGGAGNDTMTSESAISVFRSGSGDDVMRAKGWGSSEFTDYGGADGIDHFKGNVGSALIADWTSSSDDIVWHNDPNGTQWIGGQSFTGIRELHLQLGEGDDVITSAAAYGAHDSLRGGGGDDLLDGGASGDTLYGEAGNDTLTATSGEENLVVGGDGNDRVSIGGGTGSGDAGDDVLISLIGSCALDGGDGNDTLIGGDGGLGRDHLSGRAGNDHLSAGSAAYLYGGDGDDTVIGSIESDNLSGEAGNDWLEGGGGDDWFTLGDMRGQADTVLGGEGNDNFHGSAQGSSSAIHWINDPSQSQTVLGHVVSGIEEIKLTCGSGDDTVIGWSGAERNELYGEAGNDLLSGIYVSGGDGSDRLYGSRGDNSLYGGNDGDVLYGDRAGSVEGKDLLEGGAGSDTLYGGGQTDIFALQNLTGADLIGDFVSGVDEINVSDRFGIGDRDWTLERAATVTGSGGFATQAELVVVTADIAGDITAASAAAAIGSASSAYTNGYRALFAVDNGSDSALYLFTSAGADAVVSADELKLLATLEGTAGTAVGDYAMDFWWP